MVVRHIKIKDIVENTSFNKDGEIIFNLIRNSIMDKEHITVSFEGIHALNTSFVNSAFIELLEYFTFEEIKQYVSFVNSTKQINTVISKRFKDEVSGRELSATVYC